MSTDKVVPLLRLVLSIGDRVPPSVLDEAVRVFDRSSQNAGEGHVSLGPLYAHLVAHDVGADHAASFCLYLNRATEVLGVKVSLPTSVATRGADDCRVLLEGFMGDVAAQRRKMKQSGKTRELETTRGATVTQDLLKIAIAPPPTRPALLEVAGNRPGRLHVLEEGQTLVLGRSPEVDILIDEPEVCAEHAHICFRGGQPVVEPLNPEGPLLLNGEPVQHHVLEEGDRLQLGSSTVFKFLLLDALERGLLARLEKSPAPGGAGGLQDETGLLLRLRAECSHFRRHGRVFSVLRLDVDNTAEVDASQGEQVADVMLRHVAAAMRAELREEDVLGTFSGQAFTALLRETIEAEAIEVAERIRHCTSQLRLPSAFSAGGHAPPSVTLSIGVASASSGPLERPQALLDLAGARLRSAKLAGGNRVHPLVSAGDEGA